MLDTWYFGRNNTKFGPYSAAQLKGFAAQGELRPADTVWKGGVEAGVLATKVRHLFAIPQAQTGPAQPVSTAATEPDLPPQPPTIPCSVITTADSTNLAAMSGERLQGCIPDGLMLVAIPEEKDSAPPAPVDSSVSEDDLATPPEQPAPPKKVIRKLRATALRGAVIINQDGESVRYKKKCTKCGHEDQSRIGMRIRQGVTSEHFFCPKCRKSCAVAIQGTT